MLILGIETSCDETSISVVRDGKEILSNHISSQIDIHKEYGGVVPEIASRHHIKNITFVFESKKAVSKALRNPKHPLIFTSQFQRIPITISWRAFTNINGYVKNGSYHYTHQFTLNMITFLKM